MEKHREIRNEIEKRIASGKYPPGSLLPTEVKLCTQFNAARATVAHALRSLQDSGMIFRRRGVGTFVSHPDEDSGRIKKIGLMIPGIGQGEIFEPVCSAIAAHAAQFNFRISWNQIPDSRPEERQTATLNLCQKYIDEKMDGIFFEPLELTGDKDNINSRIVHLLKNAGIAVVLIDADLAYPQRSQLDLIGIDNFRAGTVLAEHLLDRGCRSPFFLHRPGSATTTQARAAGFLSVLAARGLPVSNRILEADPDHPSVAEKLTQEMKADGIVCGNDYTAALLMKTLITAGVRIPGQIKLTGVDNLKYAQLLNIPLTTLAQPCREIGLAALEMMRFRLEQPSALPRQLLLDAPLIIRESTGLGDSRTSKRKPTDTSKL